MFGGHFGGLVADFGGPDMLDLRGVDFLSNGFHTTLEWDQLTSGSTASGTLVVSDWPVGPTAYITLLGQYTAANFHIQNDGFGGTLVTDPPVSASNQNQLTLANAQH